MISLFIPELKVQKQRAVMRETDLRLAKYSSGGLFITLIIFAICMMFGQYQQLRSQMTLILSVGLIFFTLLRGYFLFRFDTLYARAPAKWRNTFFFTSLLSVTWWSFMVANVTLVVGIEAETPLLWLYTTVFLSSVANAYAPYRRFLTLYLFIGLTPTAATAIFIGTPLSLFYGLMLLVLFLMLHNQALDVSRNYWERLQANFDLKKRAYDLEVEKIDNESSIASNSLFMKSFSQQLKSFLSDVVGALQLLKFARLSDEEKQLVALVEQAGNRQVDTVNNVLELTNVTDKSLSLEIDIVNLSRHIEQVVDNLAFTAHQKQVEVYCIFSPDFPVCIRTDASRISHMLGNLINSLYQYCAITELVVKADCTLLKNADAEFRLEATSEIASELSPQQQAMFEAFNASKHLDATMHLDLNLAITKRLAQRMGGDFGIDYHVNRHQITLWFTAQVEVVANKNPETVNVPKFNNKRLLFYRPPDAMCDTLINMFHSWGLEIAVSSDCRAAIHKINDATQSTEPFHLIIVYTEFDNSESLQFSAALANMPEYRQLPQILIYSQQQKNLPQIEQHVANNPQIKSLLKPIKQQPLLQLIKQLLIQDQIVEKVQVAENGLLQGAAVLLMQNRCIDRLVAEGMLKKLGCKVTSVTSLEDVLTAIEKTVFDGFIIETHADNNDVKMVVESIRNAYKECANINDTSVPRKSVNNAPILGLSSQVLPGEETYCLSAGMDGYIGKPLQLDELRATLSRWLRRQESTPNSH